MASVTAADQLAPRLVDAAAAIVWASPLARLNRLAQTVPLRAAIQGKNWFAAPPPMVTGLDQVARRGRSSPPSPGLGRVRWLLAVAVTVIAALTNVASSTSITGGPAAIGRCCR